MQAPLRHDELDRLKAAVEAAQPGYRADLEALVNIDSGSHTRAGVNEVADLVATRLASVGAAVVRHAHAELGDTIVATLDGDADGPTVLLIGHTDTVFDAGTSAERPYSVADGRAYGPGVGDMKAGLLAGVAALAALRATADDVADWLPVGRVIFVVNPDEEIGSPASTPIIRELAAEADVALILEGARPGGQIVTARKGMMHFRTLLKGRSAHAGVEPEKGRSAILDAANKTVALHALNGRWEGVSVNVGSINGGSRPNIVADEAIMTVDTRALDAVAQESATKAIRSILDTPSVPDVTSTTEITAHHRPFEKLPAAARLVEMAIDLASGIGFELSDTSTGGGSDGNTTAGMGVPTLDGLGPVSGAAHAPDEYVELSSVVPRTTLLAALILSLGRDSKLLG